MAQISGSRKLDQYIVRLPDGMRERIKAAAEKNSRSMNAEIVAALEAAFPLPEAGDGLVQFLKKWIGPLAEAASSHRRAEVALEANEWAEKSGLGSKVLHIQEAKNEVNVSARLRIKALETTLTLWGKSSTTIDVDEPSKKNVRAADDTFAQAISRASADDAGKRGNAADPDFLLAFRNNLRALDNEADPTRRAVTVADINKLFALKGLGMTAWIDPNNQEFVVSAGWKTFRRQIKSVSTETTKSSEAKKKATVPGKT